MFFSPREIVSELDRHIIGQNEAKRAVAVALRNRWRRQQLSAALREEVVPKNILMIGPTGVGKTEIARRLAKLAQAPFIKVEATKFTEITYSEIYNRNLRIMDLTATTLCQENGMPIYVFDMDTAGNLQKVINGERIGTLVKP